MVDEYARDMSMYCPEYMRCNPPEEEFEAVFNLLRLTHRMYRPN